MNEEKFTLIFDGSALQTHEMDVRNLGYALIAMGDLIQAVNTDINGNSAQVEVKVKAHKGGSYEVDFLVQAFESAKPLLDVAKLHQGDVSIASELLELIFKITGATWTGALAVKQVGGGLIALLKWLKGRQPEKIEPQKNGDVHIHIGDNYFVTNTDTLKLAKNIKVRKPVKELVSSLKYSGVDTMKIKRPSKSELEVTKSEVGYFDYSDDEDIITDTRKRTLQIVKLSFKDGDKWQMTDGGKPFSASIDDVDFLNRVKKAELSFANGDTLECDLQEKQYRKDGNLKMEYTIIKVNNHTPSPPQLRLI
jgi:hypothetical protein